MTIRRLHPVRPQAREDDFPTHVPDGTPTITPAMLLEPMCEALDDLPDEAYEVCFVVSEHGAELFWRTAGGEWTNAGQMDQAGFARD